ncbi:polycomb protein Asx-like isoform X1 [Homalodisca vitripennis]|uniref:polycomb protein Asx-like isoform X1 n=1 Tax=Homalodisca vitripennis TaxID=197043 RepID=UPI001EEBCD47|nr:polycomb protein Asx-like isoform X1 [Homalodisca vitripennis]
MVMDDPKSQTCNNKVSKTSQALSPVKLHKVKGSYGQVESGGEGEGESPPVGEGVWSISRQEGAAVVPTSSLKELRISQSHSKKVIKHALRQQAKRRRKNTTIAAGNSAPLPRILVPPQCEHESSHNSGLIVPVEEASQRMCYRPPTMLEVLSSIPGFSIKQRKRSNKKLSAAAQLEQTKEGCIDLETPDSILVNTNLRSLLNKHTFNTLPPLYQYKLVQLLPHVDRTTPAGDSFRLSASGLNNEFFARACLEWRERLAEGEFTPENQQKLKAEAEREKSKLDPWKLKHFEPIWGESAGVSGRVDWPAAPAVVPAPPPTPAPTKPKAAVKVKTPPAPPPPPRLRTVGAITRAVANYREKREAEENSMLEPNKRVKSSNKTDNNVKSSATAQPPPCTVTSVSPPSNPVTESKVHVEESRTVEEVKVVEEKKKDNWTGDQTNVDLKSESVEETVTKCSEPSISEWENVEVISVDPVQEYVDVNTQVEREETELSEGDKLRLVCDISASEEETAAVAVAEVEEIITKEDMVTIEEMIVKDVTDVREELQEASAPLSQTNEEVEEDDDDEEEGEVVIEKEISEDRIDDSAIAEPGVEESEVVHQLEQHEERSVVNESEHSQSETIENESLEGNNDENSQEEMAGEICDKSIYAATEECEAMEVQEELKEEFTALREIESLDNQESNITLLPVDTEMNLTQETELERNVRSEEEKAKMDMVSEFGSVPEEEVIEEGKFPEAINEENLSEGRYDVDMTDINNPLEFVSEEASLQASMDVQMNTSQDSIGSQSDLKEDAMRFSVKLEEEIDLQDTASNIQSQDSQDTRADEDSSCPQDNSSDLVLPDSETTVACVEGVREMADQDYNMYNSMLYQEALKEEEVEAAALFAAAWGAVDSSTEKLLAQVALQEEGEVNVIPMQEELEVRLEEVTGQHTQQGEQPAKPVTSPQYQGHVKLELEVTLTPEVDSQVSSTMDSGGLAGSSRSTITPGEEAPKPPPLTVIPPTTIVCLPSATHTPAPPTTQPPQGVVSSSAVPYLALTTSTPVRALPTKPKLTSGGPTGRSSRNVSTKPPPGAVNLERSYQICQAVIQNSPNRDQLRCQLKPPTVAADRQVRQDAVQCGDIVQGHEVG